MRFFSPNNPIFRAISRVGDMFVISLLWVVFSLPLVTMGAATTALVAVAAKITVNTDGGKITEFWTAFRNKFGVSTKTWLLTLVIGGILASDIYFWLGTDGNTAAVVVMIGLSIGAAIVFAAVAIWLFPVIALADCGHGVRGCVRLSVRAAAKNWRTTISVLGTYIAIFALYRTFPITLYAMLIFGNGLFSIIFSTRWTTQLKAEKI